MFKYDQFPILKIQVYDNQGILHCKKFRLKSHEPYFSAPSHLLINVIDFQTSEHMTLKKIFKTKDLSKDNTLAEIYNQSRMRKNENFIEIKQVYEDHDFIYLLMEPTQTSLQQILGNRLRLFQRQVQYIFCQLVTILQCLRRNNIFHGNITLNNLFLDQKTKKLKLSGFGHSIDMEKVSQNLHTNLYSYEQINPYLAPQLFDSNIESPHLYYGGDIWAVGVVIFTLLTGQQPFINIDESGIKSPSLIKIKNFTYQFPKSFIKQQPTQNFSQLSIKNTSAQISPEWKQLLKRIFIQKQKRIKLYQLIQHPLNIITESKFMQMQSNDLYVPRIQNNFLSGVDQQLEDIVFCDGFQQLFGLHHKSRHITVNVGQSKNKQNDSTQNNKNKKLSSPPNLLNLVVTNEQKQKSTNSESTAQPKELLTGGQINTTVLKLILEQTRKKNSKISSVSIQPPLLCQKPTYIQKYCYIQRYKCIGYIVENMIGVIYNDGSCVIGQNEQQYTYMNNEAKNIQQVLKIYCSMYDQFYQQQTPTCAINKTNSKIRNKNYQDYINQDIVNYSSSTNSNNSNLNINNNSNSTINNTNTNNNTTNNFNKTKNKYNQSTATGIGNGGVNGSVNGNMQKNNSFLLPNNSNSNSIVIPNSNLTGTNHYNFNNSNPNNTNSNSNSPNTSSKMMGQKQKNPKNKMIELSNSNNKSNLKNSTQNVSSNMNQQPNMKRYNSNSNQISTGGQFIHFAQSFFSYNQIDQVSNKKYQIFKFVVGEFGDRVVYSPLKVWVTGFWRISSGFVFLYSTGTWQVNFNRHKQTPNYTHKYDGKQKQQAKKDYKRVKQCAILIDKYGLAWWLSSNKNIVSQKKSDANLGMDINFNIGDRYKQKIKCRNNNEQGNDSLSIKLARKIISIIKKSYIKQYEQIMQPYKYSKIS